MTQTLHDDDLLSELRDSARRFLAPHASVPPETSGGNDGPAKPEWWPELAALGWLGLLAPEQAGGADAGIAAAAVILEELAYAGAVTPFMSSAVLATRALGAAVAAGPSDSCDLAGRWLTRLVEGTATGTVAVTGKNGLAHRGGIGITARTGAAGDVQLDGTAHYVADAEAADVLLVAAVSPSAGDSSAGGARGELSIVAVERTWPGVTVEPLITHDRGHRLSHVTLRQVACPPQAVLLRGPAAETAFAAVVGDGLYALAADSLGSARRAFDLALQYAKQRHQFGRPIGSFQAVKHKLADMYMRLTGSSALLRAAAAAADDGDDRSRSLLAVGCYVREAAASIAGDALQVHGAAGYTWEHPCHWLLKRAKFNERYLSTLWAERDRLAGLVLAQPDVAQPGGAQPSAAQPAGED
jgi:alkylation response protein AidB-like acyl-CoA dehydrogenase